MTEETLSIGQLSALTGVKTITLRAWERRYGLLVPKRKPSGHRCYALSDVDKIREIRFWLDKGIAISKVKTHLEGVHSQDPLENTEIHMSLLQIKDSAERFQQAKLKSQIDELYALYPIDFLIERILPEIMKLLSTAKPDSLCFFAGVFRHKLRESLFSAVTSKGSKKLLIGRSDKPFSRLNVLSLALILTVYDYTPTVLERPVYIENIPNIMLRGGFDGFIFFTNTETVALEAFKDIASTPWLKVIVSQKPLAFERIPTLNASTDKLNDILAVLQAQSL